MRQLKLGLVVEGQLASIERTGELRFKVSGVIGNAADPLTSVAGPRWSERRCLRVLRAGELHMTKF